MTPPSTPTPTVRHARASDHEAVTAFTRDTWATRDVTDYLPGVFADWVDEDGSEQRTFVADARDDTYPTAEPGDVVGVLKVNRLSPWESWASGMRVAPARRDEGVARALTEAAFAWARDRGCAVCRSMTFSWNGPALGTARRLGFEPCTELRWAHPTPDADAEAEGRGEGASDLALDATPAPDGAWGFWSGSAARDALRGLVMDDGESWALSTLTRERLRAAADEGRLVTVDSGQGFAERVRTFEREEEGDPTTYAEYAVGAWPPGDADAAAAVLAGVARDAASVGADRTRMMLPEGVAWASDASTARSEIADEPAFVLSARL